MRLSFLALLNTLAGHPPYIERAWTMRTNFFAGIAPVVITSGGAAADPKFSEGGVGHDY